MVVWLAVAIILIGFHGLWRYYEFLRKVIVYEQQGLVFVEVVYLEKINTEKVSSVFGWIRRNQLINYQASSTDERLKISTVQSKGTPILVGVSQVFKIRVVGSQWEIFLRG